MNTSSPIDGGIMAAVLTPLNDDLSPNHAAWLAHGQNLIAQGCTGLAVLGTTSEANSFSVAERLAMLDALGASDIDAELSVPGVGCCAIPDTVELCRKSLEIGAAGVLMLPPFYYKGVSDDGIFAGFSEVIQRLGDDRLKIFIYHFPQMSAVPFSYDLIERFQKEYPTVIVGMKDSSGELENMAGAAERFPGFAVFSGSDELLLPLLRRGGAGCITACANVVSSLAGELWRAWNEEGDGETVARVHERLTQARLTIYKYPLPPALKALTARNTGDEGWLTVRPPLRNLSDADRDALFQAFDAIGVDLPKAA